MGITDSEACIERAEHAAVRIERLVEAAGDVALRNWTFMGGDGLRAMQALRDALADVRGGALA